MNVRKRIKRSKSIKRIRSCISSDRSEMLIFLSGKYVYLQLTKDSGSATLCASSSLSLVDSISKSNFSPRSISAANLVGVDIANKILKMKSVDTSKISFNRGNYPYHGVVKAAWEGFLSVVSK